MNVSTLTNRKQTSKPTNKKDLNNFVKTGEKIHIAKKEEREKKTLSSFVLLALLRIYTFFLTFDTLCSFPQIVKPETDRSGGAWQLCLVLNSNKP